MGEEDEADPDPHRRLDRLQADSEREALGIGDAVRDERKRDRGLHQPDVARPEREDRRHVHQHQHEPGCGHRRVDVEGAHRRVDREELEEPAEALERDRPHGGPAGAHHAEPVATHRDHAPDGAEALDPRALVEPCAREREREEGDPDGDDDDQARHRPGRDLGEEHDVHDEDERPARGRRRGARRPCRRESPRGPSARASGASARPRARARPRGPAGRRSRTDPPRTPRTRAGRPVSAPALPRRSRSSRQARGRQSRGG